MSTENKDSHPQSQPFTFMVGTKVDKVMADGQEISAEVKVENLQNLLNAHLNDVNKLQSMLTRGRDPQEIIDVLNGDKKDPRVEKMFGTMVVAMLEEYKDIVKQAISDSMVPTNIAEEKARLLLAEKNSFENGEKFKFAIEHPSYETKKESYISLEDYSHTIQELKISDKPVTSAIEAIGQYNDAMLHGSKQVVDVYGKDGNIIREHTRDLLPDALDEVRSTILGNLIEHSNALQQQTALDGKGGGGRGGKAA